MLILEGSDQLGKTTFARLIVKIAAERAKIFFDSLDDGSDSYVPVDTILPRPIYYAHMTRPNMAFDFFHHYKDMMSMWAVQDRFHIGGVIWHDDRISARRMRIIESWLTMLGSYTIIFVATDEDWYANFLETARREQSQFHMFDNKTHVAANSKYLEIVGGTFHIPVHYDQVVFVDENTWPDEKLANAVLDRWLTVVEETLDKEC